MNEKEEIGARELLSGLNEDDVIDLAKTVTKGKFSAENKQEAIDLIIKYETSSKSLLSRKKISADLLSRYLHCKSVKFSIDSTKLILCDTVISVWNSFNLLIENKSVISSICDVETKNSISDQYLHIESASKNQSLVQSVGLSEADITSLGLQFVDWFYSQLRGPDLQLKILGSEHFFTDACCKVHLGDLTHEGTSGEDCASIITASLQHIGSAIPVANNPGGVISQASSHGAIKIIACGTLHAHPARMLGAFEQAFLLVKDPTQLDNWKIRYTELRLKSQSNNNTLDKSSTLSIQ